jgi:hypothetical protein
MRRSLSLAWAFVAVTSGTFVLLGYFVSQETLTNIIEHSESAGFINVLIDIRLILLEWAVLLSAVGLMIGLLHLAFVHYTKVAEQQPGWPYSGLLILTFALTLGLGLFLWNDPNPPSSYMFKYLQYPVEAALMGLLAISLTLAGFRLVGRSRDRRELFFNLVFIGTAIFYLIGTRPWATLLPMSADLGGIDDVQTAFIELRNQVVQILAAAGGRGVLLGVSLGAIITGLRILLMVDRPYGE